MERITLTNLHEQLDSLRSTSIPQVKRYFQKRIVRCINECKTQALNMKKSIESSSSHSRSRKDSHNSNDYELGWGSDFDEDDEDDDDQGDEVNKICDSRVSQSHQGNLVQSLSSLHLKEGTSKHPSQVMHSVSLQSFSSLESPRLFSTIESRRSNSRPASDPPPPPLPSLPPPSSLIEGRMAGHWTAQNATIEENNYEIMTATSGGEEDEYLLPNSLLPNGAVKTGGDGDTYVYGSGSQGNGNYEYIQYQQINSHPDSLSDSGSLFSSNSRSNLRCDSEVINERPLPPLPNEGQVEDRMLTSFSWFHNLEREEAEKMLKRIDAEGVYLVRKSKRAGLSNPFTLTLYHNNAVFHLNVRKRPQDGLYALGKEKYKERTFASVAELVEYHNSEPIFLTSKGEAAGKTRLIYTPSSSHLTS